MNITEKIYLMYYFLIREDKQFSKKGRAFFLIETILTMLFACLLFILFGFLNIRINSIVSAGVFAVLCVSLSYFTAKHFYSKNGKDTEAIKKGDKCSKKHRKRLMLIGGLSIPIVFILMILGAVLMSYLWSLHK